MSRSAPEPGSYVSRRRLVRWTGHWIRERKPVAVVRFLEGEGRLLAADPADPASMKVAINKLRRQTGLTFSPEAALAVRARVMHALDTADVLGIRGGATFPDEHKAWMERIGAIYADRVAAGRPPALIAHSRLNDDFYAFLPRLLALAPLVSVISCRDVKPVLESEYGLEDVRVFQVPSQYVVRDVDDDYEAALHDVPIWPDVHARLHSELTVREPGEVFLVGAGLFGKDLCTRVRDLGGIALDIGSSLDRMVDKVTRGSGRPTLRPPPATPRVVT